MIQKHLEVDPPHGLSLLFGQTLKPGGFSKTPSWRAYCASRLNLPRHGKRRLPERIRGPLGGSGTDSARELSAICTHPDFAGRGYARRLTAMLTNDTLRQGRLPFLHVSYENPRAMRLYEQIGFRLRRDIPFWSLSRVGG